MLLPRSLVAARKAGSAQRCIFSRRAFQGAQQGSAVMPKHTRSKGPRLPRAQQPTIAEGGINHRQGRLEHILHQELQNLFRSEVSDPDLQSIVVIAVELSADGGAARIAYAVEGNSAVESVARRASRDALARA